MGARVEGVVIDEIANPTSVAALERRLFINMKDSKMAEETPVVGTFEARAHGAHFPSQPGQTGYAVSAWAIFDPASQKWVFGEAVSKLPNRWSWEAGIRALQGPVEWVPKQAALVIYTANQELAEMFQSRFRRSDGSLAAGSHYAEELFAIIRQKGLTVSVVWQKKDSVTEHLQAFAKLAVMGKRKHDKAA